MLAGINDILMICNREDLRSFKSLLGDGKEIGIKLSYQIQDKPRGIAHALLLAERFLSNSPCCLILGDNIFYGTSFQSKLIQAVKEPNKAVIFTCPVSDPQRFGVAEVDSSDNVLSIQEKPKVPKSNLAVTGLYFYRSGIVSLAKEVKPSDRGELEITDLNNLLVQRNNLKAMHLGRGSAWLDAGTCKSLLEASNFVSIIEERQGLKIGCIEEVALRQNWISKSQLQRTLKGTSSTYERYLVRLVDAK